MTEEGMTLLGYPAEQGSEIQENYRPWGTGIDFKSAYTAVIQAYIRTFQDLEAEPETDMLPEMETVSACAF